MLHQEFTAQTINPLLPQGLTPVRLTAYCRSRAGTLADSGRWGVLVLPGGGYRRTAYGEGEPVALSFLQAGVQAFVLDYSVSPDRWPQPFLETAAALDFIRRNAADYGIDRVAVCGFSAGGHLAGCMANHWGHPLLAEVLGLQPEQVRPDASILCYPVISDRWDTKGGTFRNLVGEGPVPGLLRLETQVTPQTPPTFLWSTWADGTVPVRHSLAYLSALLEAGVSCESHIYAKGPHAMGTATAESVWSEAYIDPQAASWLPLCLGWLKGVE